jgi:hypothetical protein
MGSVWFTHDGRSLLWRKPFPADVRDQVVSMKNPQGQVTNSDLELAGTPVHQQMLGNMHTCKVKQCTRCVTTCPWLLGLTRDPPQLPSAMPTCCYKLRLSNRPNKLATTESVTYPVTTTAWHMMPADSGTLTTKHYSPILTVCTSRSTCGSFACRMSSWAPEWYWCSPRWEIASGITPAQAKQAWKIWVDFCKSINTDLGLGPIQVRIRSQHLSSLPNAGKMVAWHPKGSRSMLKQWRMLYEQWAMCFFPHWGPRTPTTMN